MGLLGYAFCASFCTMGASICQMERLISRGFEIQPIMSENAYTTDTRFHKAEDFINKVEKLSGRKIIHTVKDAEPLGPKTPLDGLIIAPCTGNTLAKISLGITDTAVTMAAKAHLRQDRPTLIALATNDGLSRNLVNIGKMIMHKSVFFVPMRQDDPFGKPHSLVADMERLEECYEEAQRAKQVRPVFI